MNIFFVVPGLSEKYRTGGLMVLQNLTKLLGELPGTKCQFIATHENHPDAISEQALPNYLTTYNLQPVFIVSWGPLIHDHIKLIRKHAPNSRILYYAQSFGWGIKVPLEIPIVCVSNYVAERWRVSGKKNILGVVPPPLNPVFSFGEGPRDIDILVHTRKQNEYCLKKLIRGIRDQGSGISTKIIENWIPQTEFAALLKRAKIFLYITAPHTYGRLFKKTFAEGFGLPALEALACGTLVGSNLLGGVHDFLKPGENCIELGVEIGAEALEKDTSKIQLALKNFRPDSAAAKQIAAQFSSKTVIEKWKIMLQKIETVRNGTYNTF